MEIMYHAGRFAVKEILIGQLWGSNLILHTPPDSCQKMLGLSQQPPSYADCRRKCPSWHKVAKECSTLSKHFINHPDGLIYNGLPFLRSYKIIFNGGSIAFTFNGSFCRKVGTFSG